MNEIREKTPEERIADSLETIESKLYIIETLLSDICRRLSYHDWELISSSFDGMYICRKCKMAMGGDNLMKDNTVCSGKLWEH